MKAVGAVGAGVGGAFGPGWGRDRRRLPDGQYGDWFGQLVDGGLAAAKADDRVTRELNRAYLKRPGRGVPPPRSGPHPPVLMHNGHTLLYKCVVSLAEHLQALRVYVYENSVRAWVAP